MALDARHPDYAAMRYDWDEVRDAYKGERWVKGLGRKYLPPTVGMVLDGLGKDTDPGLIAYEAYKMRAQFPDYMQVGPETLVGILNAKPWDVKVPAGMEYVIEKATNRGEKLKGLIRRINAEQVTTGRVGLLVDLPVTPDQTNPQPYIAMYGAESMINWDDSNDGVGENKLNFVVLDESTNVRDPINMTWTLDERYRVLELTNDGYLQGLFTQKEYTRNSMKAPSIRGKTLKDIPFVFINSKDNLSTPDLPPLLGLARLCMSIYRSEADYRQALFLQGQDTLVVVGGLQTDKDKPLRVGAGSKIDVNVGGDAKFIGLNSQGIPEMRTALENDRKQASVRTGQLLAPGKMSQESGEALKTRVAAQTATLTSVALCCAAGLERALKFIAEWLGKDPAAVKVTPNLDFTNIEIAGQDIVQLITAKNLGMPLSFKSLHTIAHERGLTKKTFEEEMKEIEEDPKLLTERATELAAKLKGNNPLESAGGPKTTPDNKGNEGNRSS
jgi:hypothetical protein